MTMSGPEWGEIEYLMDRFSAWIIVVSFHLSPSSISLSSFPPFASTCLLSLPPSLPLSLPSSLSLHPYILSPLALPAPSTPPSSLSLRALSSHKWSLIASNGDELIVVQTESIGDCFCCTQWDTAQAGGLN